MGRYYEWSGQEAPKRCRRTGGRCEKDTFPQGQLKHTFSPMIGTLGGVSFLLSKYALQIIRSYELQIIRSYISSNAIK